MDSRYLCLHFSVYYTSKPFSKNMYVEVVEVYAAMAGAPNDGDSAAACGGGTGPSSLVLSAIILLKPIPTPSMTASNIAQDIAPFRIGRQPPRTASEPPVKKPAMMAFHGSSFFLMPFTAQSYALNRPPQTPKLPPSTGARALIAVIAPMRRSP
jgi:hypothetical protein